MPGASTDASLAPERAAPSLQAPVLTGLGHVLGLPCDPTPYLKSKKSRKFMGAQDELAVVATGRALEAAGLLGRPLGRRLGLYLAVGYIPFEAEDIDRLMENSTEDGKASLRRFSTDGFQSANPLLTFRCLCNMPAFHISVNFEVRGPYLVTYPGPGQFYSALEAACLALEAGEVDAALVGGVAHQGNFLVRHHFSRLLPPVPPERLADAAACLLLESPQAAQERGAKARGRLLSWEASYRSFDPFRESRPLEELFEGGGDGAQAGRAAVPSSSAALELGCASLPAALSQADAGSLRHRLKSRDGISAESLWDLTP